MLHRELSYNIKAGWCENYLGRDRDYERADLLVGRWKPPRGFFDVGHYITAIDSIEHAHVIWRSYETRRYLTHFNDIC